MDNNAFSRTSARKVIPRPPADLLSVVFSDPIPKSLKENEFLKYAHYQTTLERTPCF